MFIARHKKNLVLHMVLGTFVMVGFFTNPVTAKDCAYLGHYLAPFNLPVDEWPEVMVGPPPGVVRQKEVGPQDCSIISERIIHTAEGVPYRQVTVGISGTVFGYTDVIGRRSDNFADHFFIAQTEGMFGPFIPGIARYGYSEETPAGVEILIPQDPENWNGILWVLAHGGSNYSSLNFRPRKPGKFNRYQNTGQFAGELIDRGYAVSWTRRSGTGVANPTDAMEEAVLYTDVTVGGPGKIGMGLNNSTALLRDYTVITRNFIEEQLGRRPRAILWRGHSAGGALGRSFNLIPGMNTDHDGKQLFQGFYISDTAGGRGAPTYFYEGKVLDKIGTYQIFPSEKDYLTFSEDQVRFMAPVIETAHAAYAGNKTTTVPRISKRIPTPYIELKRENARLYAEKGLNPIWRFFEIADVSHGDAAGVLNRWPEMAAEMIDIGGVSLALKEALVQWVLDGKEPPATRVDAADVWAVNPDAGPAIRLPESACPRGIFREYMADPSGRLLTSSAVFIPYLTRPVPQANAYMMANENWVKVWNAEAQAMVGTDFQEEWLEPLDGRGYLVDMTGSFTRRTRPTIEQAWKIRYRRGYKTGVLTPYESLTRARYLSCVTKVAADLYADRLLTKEALDWYIEKAMTDDIGVD